MGICSREQRVLDLIDKDLSGSDPGLAARFALFNRLTAGEPFPGPETVPACWPQAPGIWRTAAAPRQGIRRTVAGPRRGTWRRPRRLRGRTAMVLLWLLISAVLVVVAVTVGGGHPGCEALVPACSGQGTGQGTATPAATTR